MKVLFDTNIIIDVISQREPFFSYSDIVFNFAVDREIDGIVSAGSIKDILYILKRNNANSEFVRKEIKKVMVLFDIVFLYAEDINSAFELNFKDDEDAIIAATAAREGADYIITRNEKDFAASPVKAISPADFLQLPAIKKYIDEIKEKDNGVQR